MINKERIQDATLATAYAFLISQIFVSSIFNIGSALNIFNLIIVFLITPILFKKINKKLESIIYFAFGCILYLFVYLSMYS